MQPIRSSFLKFFYGLLVLTFLFYTAYKIIFAFYLVPNTGGIETNIIYFIQRAIAGEAVYTDPEMVPYSIAQYTPLYYYIASGIAQLLNIGADEVGNIYTINRLLTLFCNLLLCFLAGYLGKKCFGLSAGKQFAVSVFVFIFFIGYSRSDSMSSLFWVASFSMFCMQMKKGGRASWSFYFLLSLFIILAFLSKQNAVTIGLIIFAWLLYKKRFSEILRFMGAMLALSLVVFLPLLLASDVQVLYKNIVLGINNGFAIGEYVSYFVNDFYLNDGILISISLFVAVILLRKEREDRYGFLLWAMVIQFLLSNFFALKDGAGLNYFTEWMVLLFLALGIYADRLNQWLGALHPATALVVLNIVLISRLSFIFPNFRWLLRNETYQQSLSLYGKEKSLADYLVKRKGSAQFYVFNNLQTELTYLNNFLIDQAIMPQLDIVKGAASYDRKIYDYSHFKKLIDSGDVDFIIIRYPETRLKFYDLSFDHYKRDTVMYGYSVFVSGRKVEPQSHQDH